MNNRRAQPQRVIPNHAIQGAIKKEAQRKLREFENIYLLYPNDKLKQGVIKQEYDDGSSYVGEVKNSKKHGFGKYTFPSFAKSAKETPETYFGEFRNDSIDGTGSMIYSQGSFYEGGFRNKIREGDAVYNCIDGSVYEGEFQGDLKNGLGTLKMGNGDIYQGYFYNGLFDGEGTYKSTFRNISGVFKDGILDGQAEI